MGPYKPMRPVTETWPMLFFPIHTTNLHVGSTDYYDNVCYMGSLQAIKAGQEGNHRGSRRAGKGQRRELL